MLPGILYDFMIEHEERFYCFVMEENMEVHTISCEVVWLHNIFDGLFDNKLDSIDLSYMRIIRERGRSNNYMIREYDVDRGQEATNKISMSEYVVDVMEVCVFLIQACVCIYLLSG